MSKSIPLILKLEHDGKVLYASAVDDLPDVFTIGRSSVNTWVMPREDHSASANHGKIEKKGKKLLLIDLDSKNGIYFQGNRIDKSIIIKEGEVYSIGECKLIAEKSEQKPKKMKSTEKFHKLEQLSGDDKGKIIKLSKETTWIGSDKECDIVISHSLVSHRHSQIQSKNDGTCWICDGDEKGNPSKNGTRVNQAPVTTLTTGGGRMLKDGDIISVVHVDYRFWDRNVVHVRSHIVLKTMVVVLTVALVVGGYFGAQAVLPSAKRYRLLAEKAAANEDFKQAKEFLGYANSSRGADDDALQRQELLRKLDLWSDTSHKWNGIVKMLAAADGQNWQEINKQFASLIYTGHENWRWNSTTAVEKMKVAQDTQELLSSMLTVEKFLMSSSNDFKYLEQIAKALQIATDKCGAKPLEYRQALLHRANDILTEANSNLQEYKEAVAIVNAFTDVTDAPSVFDKISQIRKKNQERFEERKNKKMACTMGVKLYCDNLLIPLEGISKSYECLQSNYIRLANFDKSASSIILTLPTAQQCIVSKNFADRCSDLLKIKENQELILKQLMRYKAIFTANELFIGQTSSALNELFNDQSLIAVLDCDCLRKRPPGYNDKDPSSRFDLWLGVNVFIDYLNSLEGDFDSSLLDDRFKPLVFLVLEKFELINSFLDFCYAKNSKALSSDMKKIRDVSPAKNTVLKLMVQSEDYLDKKTKLMRKLLQIYLADPNGRKGIIAGGILCLMRSKQTSFVPEDFHTEVYKSFIKLHKEVGQLLDMEANRTPEVRRQCEAKALEIGIPGDLKLKPLWDSIFQNGARN